MTDVIHFQYQVDDSQLSSSAQKVEGLAKSSEQAAQKSSSFLGGIIDSAAKVGFALYGIKTGVEIIGSAFQGLIGSNLQFEGFQTRFEVMLGSADKAKERMQELEKFGRTTPFELPGVVQASVVLETLTQGALSTGDGLRLVGDVASGTGRPIEELAQWFGRLYDGIKSGRPVGEAMARLQELGAVSGDLRNKIEEMQKAGVDGEVVWATLEDGMGRYSGMMEKQSQTVGGALSNISDGLGALKRNLMEGIFQAAKPLFFGIAAALGNEGVQKAALEAGIAVGEVLGKAVEGVSDLVKIGMDLWDEYGSSITGTVRDVVEAVVGFGKDVYDTIGPNGVIALAFGPLGLLIQNTFGIDLIGGAKKFFDFLKTDGLPAAKDFAEQGMKFIADKGKEAADYYKSEVVPAFKEFQDLLRDELLPTAVEYAKIGWSESSGSVLEFADAFGELMDKMQPVFDLWSGMSTDIWEELLSAFSNIGKAIKEELGPAFASWGPTIEAAMPALKALGEFFGVVLVAAVTAALWVLRELVPIIEVGIIGAIRALGIIIEGLAKIFEGTFLVITGIWNTFKGLFTGDWDTMWKGLGQVLEGGMKIVEGVVGTALELLLNNFRTIYELINQLTHDKLGELVGWFAALPGNIASAVGDLSKLLWQKAQDLLGGMRDGVVDYWNSWQMTWWWNFGGMIVEAIGDVGKLLWDVGWALIKGMRDGVVAAWNWFKDEVLGILDPRNWDIPGRSPLLDAMEHTGLDAGVALIGGMATGIEASFDEVHEMMKKNAAELAAITVAGPSPLAGAYVPNGSGLLPGEDPFFDANYKHEGPIPFGTYDGSGYVFMPKDLPMGENKTGTEATFYAQAMEAMVNANNQVLFSQGGEGWSPGDILLERELRKQAFGTSGGGGNIRSMFSGGRSSGGQTVYNIVINGGVFKDARAFAEEVIAEFERRVA